METTVHVFQSSRDWIEWVVDIGGIVGGIAALVAIGIAVIGLRESARLRRESTLERKRERLNHRMMLLERVGTELAQLADAFEGRNFVLARRHWRQLRIRLQLGKLEDKLPLAKGLADGMIAADRWDERTEDVIEHVLPEVVDAISRAADELAAVPEPEL